MALNDRQSCCFFFTARRKLIGYGILRLTENAFYWRLERWMNESFWIVISGVPAAVRAFCLSRYKSVFKSDTRGSTLDTLIFASSAVAPTWQAHQAWGDVFTFRHQVWLSLRSFCLFSVETVFSWRRLLSLFDPAGCLITRFSSLCQSQTKGHCQKPKSEENSHAGRNTHVCWTKYAFFLFCRLTWRVTASSTSPTHVTTRRSETTSAWRQQVSTRRPLLSATSLTF